MTFEAPEEYTEIKGKNGPVYVYTFEKESEFHRPPATEEDIQFIEDKIGHSFPEELRNWYKKYHGMKVFPRGFRYQFDKADMPIMHLALEPHDTLLTNPKGLFRYTYLLDEANGRGLNFLWRDWHLRDYLKEGYFAIGDTEVGTEIVMDFREGPTNGYVYALILHGAADIIDEDYEASVLRGRKPGPEVRLESP